MSDAIYNHRALSGKYRGELLDDSTRRSIRLRNSREVEGECRHGSAILDFFYHEGQYWKAELPLAVVADLSGQAFNFSKPRMKAGPDGPEKVYDENGVPRRTIPMLNHLQTRFRLKDNEAISLFPLGSDMKEEPTHRVDDFVYSIEAVGPVGVGFNLRDGLNGSLISAHRFLSTQEMVFERCVVEGQYVTESPPLPVEDDVKQRLLWATLLRSHRAGMEETYYLYRCCATNNCTSGPFQMLDRIAKYRWQHRLGSMLYRLPLSPRFYLRARGLDASPKQFKLVRTEFQSYINDRATQQRKRDYVRAKMKAVRAARKRAVDLTQ